MEKIFPVLATSLIFALVVVFTATGELLQNGGFESTNGWDCSSFHCTLSTDKHDGQFSVNVSGRTQYYHGPIQTIKVTANHLYLVDAWVKLLNDHSGQNVEIMLAFQFSGGGQSYQPAASHSNAKTSEGWIHLQGSFLAPSRELENVRLYFQSGPSATINFLVDAASVTDQAGARNVSFASLDKVIDQQRKSNINFHISTAAGINTADVEIHILQTKKSFPFGTAVNAWKYNENAAEGKYRNFIHEHFNWAVPESTLKWLTIEPQRGHKNYQLALDMIHGVKNHGLKVRGHNLVWSVEQFVPSWVRQLSIDELRTAVKQHIEETMNQTRGLLEHWDVNNENLHGTWFQDRLQDPDYDLELFRITHNADPSIKLFLNDYAVVASGGSTNDYLLQAQRFKAANVGLYGIGVQCHFGEPDIVAMTERLDLLAQAGVPIWATELDVVSADEEVRADRYEKALRALYGHPAVEGILFWGFWDQAHWSGAKAALVKGNNLQLTAAGRRVFDLLENQWMTDETHVLSDVSNQFTVRGFHGDYEVRVIYQGSELSSLKKTFILGKENYNININV